MSQPTGPGEVKNEERVFLHDISTPLTIAIGMVEAAKEMLAGNADAKALQMLDKGMAALERMTQQVQARRLRVKQLESEAKSAEK